MNNRAFSELLSYLSVPFCIEHSILLEILFVYAILKVYIISDEVNCVVLLNEKIVIFGASVVGRKLYSKLTDGLKLIFGYCVNLRERIVFCDNDKKKWCGRFIDNEMIEHEIFSPEDINSLNKTTPIIISALDYNSVATQLVEKGFSEIYFVYDFDKILIGRYFPNCLLLDSAYRVKQELDSKSYFGSRSEGFFTEKFIKEASKSKVFIDVGAECGFYTYLASKVMPYGSVIYAIEPQLERFNTLESVYGDTPNIKFINAALSSQEGIADLYAVHTDGHQISSGSMDKDFSQVKFHGSTCEAIITGELYENSSIKSFKAKTITMDKLLDLGINIDLIKMDIEGAEVFALEGMQKTLSQGNAKVLMQIHPLFIESLRKDGLQHIVQIITAAGYTIYTMNYGSVIQKLSGPLTQNDWQLYLVPPSKNP